MKWKKQGLIYAIDGTHKWMCSHAQVPLADPVSPDIVRIYYGTRDSKNRTLTTFIDVEAENPRNILYVHDKPVLELGALGTFDENGVMPSWIVDHEGRKYLYYIGWNIGATVRYRLSIGLAVSDDGGRTFARLFDGPIFERSHIDPYFVSNPAILIDNGVWKMWYMSCTRWVEREGLTEPYYHIRYATSSDGINWKADGTVCIDYKNAEECGIARPFVMLENGVYKLWYCYRGISEYRTNLKQSYRIGYAESPNGIDWKRMDEQAGIDISTHDWDSEMVAYPYIYDSKDQRIMLYNGNGFGKSGFGYALLQT